MNKKPVVQPVVLSPHRRQFLQWTAAGAGAWLLPACGGAGRVEQFLLVPGVEAFRVASPTTSYYVNSVSGNDLADGKTAQTPWKNLSKVNALTLQPGNVINLGCGSVWSEQLSIRHSGTEQAPIVVQAYGSGEAPTIKRMTGRYEYTNGVLVTGNFVHILELRVSDVHWSAISLGTGTQYNVVAGNEIVNSGNGIEILGAHQRVLSNYIHDMTMVVDDGNAETAWGANGLGFRGEDIEIAYNRFVRCRAQSKNFGGWDGGAFEYFGFEDAVTRWNQVTRNVRIHHNFLDYCDSFIEANGQIDGLLIAYNLYVNIPGSVFEFHMRTNEGIKNTYKNVRIENNTLIEPSNASFGFWIVENEVPPYPTGGNSFAIRNNLIVLVNGVIWGLWTLGSDLVHDHNLFYTLPGGNLGSGTNLWVKVATEILTTVAPGFANYAAKDYRLTAGSVAIGAGAVSSMTSDLFGRAVPAGLPADIGAYQHA